MRIAKLLSARGVCSRREAEQFIAQGWVSVDGGVITAPGTCVLPSARIDLDPQAEALLHRQATILLHKPIGIVSGQAEKGYAPASTLITSENQFNPSGRAESLRPEHLVGLAPAGRLDIDSHGLLVLTQDGRVARALIGPQSEVDKEYLVRFEGPLTPKTLALLNHGLSLDGKALKPAVVVLEHPGLLKFVLREGRNRQIRRMCNLVGLKVLRLKRVRIGKVRLGNLPYGKWRFLGANESF